MKTVRFSNVVEKSGKPEIYLLLTKDDSIFHQALKADRIMSLLGESDRSKIHYGWVGYHEKQKGQLLLFPRSLKQFRGKRVVGIKYELFSDHKQDDPKVRKNSKLGKTEGRKNRRKSRTTPSAPIPAKKVILFPKEERDDEIYSMDDLRIYAHQALRALERGNLVAACNLLKRIVGES